MLRHLQETDFSSSKALTQDELEALSIELQNLLCYETIFIDTEVDKTDNRLMPKQPKAELGFKEIAAAITKHIATLYEDKGLTNATIITDANIVSVTNPGSIFGRRTALIRLPDPDKYCLVYIALRPVMERQPQVIRTGIITLEADR